MDLTRQSAASILLPPDPLLAIDDHFMSAPCQHALRQAHLPAARWRWAGVLVARAWDPAFTEREYQLLLAGGSTRKLASPDAYTLGGTPIWRHSAGRQQQIDRDLDRLCLHSVETPLYRSHNVATNPGRTTLLDFLAGSGSHTGLTYFAVGNSSTNPASTDTQLGNELFRKAITSFIITAIAVQTSTFFAAGEANFQYAEAGLFGDGATITANSGVLFNHASYVYNKTSSFGLTNQATISLN